MSYNMYSPCQPCCNPTYCCGDSIPEKIYFNDGFGEVELIFDGPHPAVLSTSNFAGTNSKWWWGCAPRTAIVTSPSCAGNSNVTTNVVFAFRCAYIPNTPEPNTGDLRLYAVGCIGSIGLAGSFKSGFGCEDNWPTTQTPSESIIVYNTNQFTIVPPVSCNPFVWMHSGSGFFQIYRGSATWTITE